MTWNRVIAVLLATTLSFGPVAGSWAGRRGDPYGAGDASRGAATRLLWIGLAITGGLAVTGVGIWYLVTRSGDAERAADATQAVRSGPCLDATGEPSLACW